MKITSCNTLHCDYTLILSLVSQHWSMNAITDGVNTANLIVTIIQNHLHLIINIEGN